MHTIALSPGSPRALNPECVGHGTPQSECHYTHRTLTPECVPKYTHSGLDEVVALCLYLFFYLDTVECILVYSTMRFFIICTTHDPLNHSMYAIQIVQYQFHRLS
jgi:hypothetical protein